MTIKELYNWAKSMELENANLKLDYKCGDDWYNYEGDIKINNLTIEGDDIVIDIDN